MGIRRFGLLVVAGVFLLSSRPACAELDMESAARAELQAAQAAYSSALEQLRNAEQRLARARVNAIAAGLPVADLDLAITSGAPASDEPTPPAPPAETPAKTAPKEAPKPAEKPKAEPKPEPKVEKKDEGPSFWEGWKRSVRLGLNTSTGNSENANANIQFNTERRSKKLLTRLNNTYRYATRNGNETQNRLDMQFRHEWLAQGESKIGWWVTGRAEFDEFKSWDYRLQAHGGISYQFLKNDKSAIKGRTGFGGSRTFGSANDEFRPEALVTGIDLSHRFNDTMNVSAGTEFFLEVTEESRQRYNNNVKWNFLLDKESNMNLRLELSHQYDSEPGTNREENDIYFDVTLGWKF